MIQTLIEDMRLILRGVADDLAEFSVRAAEALLIALAAMMFARWLRRRVMALSDSSRLDANTATLLANCSSIAVYAIAGTLGFTLLGGNVAVSATFLGAATVALSLALQDVLRSIVAGIYLLVERPFALGETIEVKGASGAVDAIHLRTTTLSGTDGTDYRVPNSTIFSEIVSNRAGRTGACSVVTVSNLPASSRHASEDVLKSIAASPGVREPVRFDRFELAGDTLAITMTVTHDATREAPAEIAGRLQNRFPGATITIERDAR